jgi:hypothetical protein
MKTSIHHRQRGQAMTETLITSVTILVPLFLLIPLLGKYIDINHSTIQAARYEAWEYTVWYGSNSTRSLTNLSGEKSSGFEDQNGNSLQNTQPLKTSAQTQSESRLRFYGDPTNLLTNTDTNGIGNTNTNLNPLWFDHDATANGGRGNPIIADASPDAVSGINTNSPTPDISLPGIGSIMNTILDGINVISGIFSSVISVLTGGSSSLGFNAINTNGYVQSTVNMQVVTPTGLLGSTTGLDQSASFGPLTLNFNESATVLSDGWNAGGTWHAQNQAGLMVPTKILNTFITAVPGMVQAWQVLAILAPEIAPCPVSGFNIASPLAGQVDPEGDGALWLGYFDNDAVHPDRLSGNYTYTDPGDGSTSNWSYPGTHACDSDGHCDIDPPTLQAPCN